MNYLDCIIVSNSICVCSYPNEILIASSKMKDHNFIVEKNNALIIHCSFLKNWFQIFDNFMSENEFVSSCIAYTNSPNTLKFTKTDFKLNVTGSHLAFGYSFDKSTVLEIMQAISHMYIKSLCLNSPCTLVFTALVCHFEVQPNYDETVTQILELSPKNLLDLIKSILILYDLSENSYLICATLIRYKKIIQYLYKLRCYSKK